MILMQNREISLDLPWETRTESKPGSFFHIVERKTRFEAFQSVLFHTVDQRFPQQQLSNESKLSIKLKKKEGR